MDITLSCADWRHDVLSRWGRLTMNASAEFVPSRERLSELATLTRDPALAFRRDPAFRAKFRNPDEIIEGDFTGIGAGTGVVSARPLRWASAVSWRRSPKE
jgi:hypothetical protein